MKIFSIKEILVNAWALWRANWRILVSVTLVNIAVNFLPRATDYLGTAAFRNILSPLATTLAAVFGIFVTVGSMRIVLMLVSGARPRFTDLFPNWSVVLRWLIVQLVIGLLSVAATFMLVILPILSPQSFDNPVGLGLRILYALPFFYLWLRLGFAYWPVLEGAGPVEALRKSWKITRGQVFRLILFGLALFAVIMTIGLIASLPLLAGIPIIGFVVTILVSIFFLAPFSLLSLASVYRKLAQNP